VETCGMGATNAFYLRHKILDALHGMQNPARQGRQDGLGPAHAGLFSKKSFFTDNRRQNRDHFFRPPPGRAIKSPKFLDNVVQCLSITKC